MHNGISAVPIAIAAISVLTAVTSPTIIAYARTMADRRRIMVLNLGGILLFSCWLAALAWSITGKADTSLYDKMMADKRRYLAPALGALLALTLVILFISNRYLFPMIR